MDGASNFLKAVAPLVPADVTPSELSRALSQLSQADLQRMIATQNPYASSIAAARPDEMYAFHGSWFYVVALAAFLVRHKFGGDAEGIIPDIINPNPWVSEQVRGMINERRDRMLKQHSTAAAALISGDSGVIQQAIQAALGAEGPLVAALVGLLESSKLLPEVSGILSEASSLYKRIMWTRSR